MKKLIIVALLTAICVFICTFNTENNTVSLIEMQMVYDDNPAFFFNDMKLIWDNTEYFVTHVNNAKPGREIGHATDKFSTWRIYELKGYGRDYLYAVESEDVWRVMSVHPPEQTWRQYILENATNRDRVAKMLSVTLYQDSTARLATPPISSYAMVGTYYYTFKNDELLIFQEKEKVTARFTVLDDNTLIFNSATVPLFADAGARYVRRAENRTAFMIKNLPAGGLKWDDYDFPFPKPPADSFEIDKRYANPLMCKGITTVERDAYFSQLLSDRWIKITDESPYHFIFLKGNEYLSIYLEGTDGSDTYVFGYDTGYSGENRSEAIPHYEALKYIRASYDEYQSNPGISVRDSEIAFIREVGIKDLFEKTRMQLFQAFGERGEISYFFVTKNIAFILPVGASVINHIPVFVYDIDRDGKFEIIASHNVGSGISNFVVSAYKFGNPPEYNSLNETIYIAYSNSWMEGAPCLTLKQNENGEIHLWRFSYDNNNYVLNEDYGCLVVKGNKLIPERYDLFEKSFLR